jgi:acyl-coenzyme A thioesterase PaaI-like protein
VEALSIQEQLPAHLCFGCGTSNEKGLRIRSYFRGSESVCTFEPGPEHAAGPPHVLNGGILATVIDCHAVCTAIASAYESEGRPIGSEPVIWCVTASLSVDYRRPTPIDAPLVLRARVRESQGRKIFVEVEATSRGEDVARSSVLAIRVPDDWRNPPPSSTARR